MNVKIKALTAGVLFFMGGATVMAQKKDSAETKQIEEVVVLGYVKKTATEMTSSRLQLKSEKINTPSAVSIEQALQGQAPGVVVNASSGSPGSIQNIRIRGVANFGNTGSEPLYVVDGVPVVSGDFSGSGSNTSLTGMASFNNADVESVTVLKDAAAIAPYGARGTNGVIIITTKSGKKGKTQYDLSTSIGFQNEALNKRVPLTGAQKKELLIEGVANQFGLSDTDAENLVYANNLGNITAWDGKEYNWPDLLRRKDAGIYNANFSASGGKDKSRFFASLGYNNTDPIVIGPGFERITGNLKFNQALSDKIDLETSVIGSWTNQNAILEGGSFFSNPFITKYLMTPWVNPYNADGSMNIDDFRNFTSVHNTLYTIENNINKNKLIRTTANTKLDWRLYKNLTFSTRFFIDYAIADFKNYTNRLHGDGFNTNGYSERSKSESFQWTLQNSLNYTFRVNKHKFDVTALFEYIQSQSDFLYGYGENFPADGLTNIASSGANWDASSSFSDAKRASYLGILGYNWNDRFILDATFRREGSSLFNPGVRFGNFWSVGAAYNLHKDILTNVFNELKIRGSYGKTGNDAVGRNLYQSTLNYNGSYDGNGTAYPGNFGVAGLTWEKTKTLDFGLDFAIFDKRVTGTVGYYDKRTDDVLQFVPLPRTTGFSSQLMNAGEISNKGIEAGLNVDVIRTDDFTWNISANVATVKNEVLRLAKDGNGNDLDPSAGSVYTKYEVGKEARYWNMQTWAGVNPTTGLPEWYVNGVDGATTSNYNSAARVYQGSQIPKVTGSLSTGFTYKNWSLNAMAYYAGGHKIYEQYAQFYLRTNSFTLVTYNGVDDLLNRWQNPGDVTDVPKLSFSQNNFFHNTSSRHLYDGDFIRLKDVSLGYSLPSDYVKAIGLTGLSFSVRGTNLYTWVKDKDFKLDPETGANGFTTLTTPPVKSIIFGVNVKF